MSQNVVNSYRYVPSGCFDTGSETQGGSGSGGWGLAGSSGCGNCPLGLGHKIEAGHLLVGKEILNMTVWLQLSGASLSTVDLYAYLWDGAGTPATPADYRAVSDAVSSSTIPSSPDWAELLFTFSSPATLQAGDYMSAVLPSQTGTGINYMSQGSAYETNTIAYEYRTGWTVKTFGNRFKVEYTC